MTNKKSQSTPSPSTAKSTSKTGKTSTDCITLKSYDIMKSDITPNSVDPTMPVNTANSDVAVNSNDRNTPDNTANLFNDEPTATPQPKQQRVGIKQPQAGVRRIQGNIPYPGEDCQATFAQHQRCHMGAT